MPFSLSGKTGGVPNWALIGVGLGGGFVVWRMLRSQAASTAAQVASQTPAGYSLLGQGNGGGVQYSGGGGLPTMYTCADGSAVSSLSQCPSPPVTQGGNPPSVYVPPIAPPQAVQPATQTTIGGSGCVPGADPAQCAEVTCPNFNRLNPTEYCTPQELNGGPWPNKPPVNNAEIVGVPGYPFLHTCQGSGCGDVAGAVLGDPSDPQYQAFKQQMSAGLQNLVTQLGYAPGSVNMGGGGNVTGYSGMAPGWGGPNQPPGYSAPIGPGGVQITPQGNYNPTNGQTVAPTLMNGAPVQNMLSITDPISMQIGNMSSFLSSGWNG